MIFHKIWLPVFLVVTIFIAVVNTALKRFENYVSKGNFSLDNNNEKTYAIINEDPWESTSHQFKRNGRYATSRPTSSTDNIGLFQTKRVSNTSSNSDPLFLLGNREGEDHTANQQYLHHDLNQIKIQTFSKEIKIKIIDEDSFNHTHVIPIPSRGKREAAVYPNCNPFKKPNLALYYATRDVVKTLKITQLYLVMAEEPDDCLLDILWTIDVPITIFDIDKWWMLVNNHISYISYTQHILVGPLIWLTNTIDKINPKYNSSTINAMNTKWIWVCTDDVSPTSPLISFKQIMEEASVHLLEGMLGVLVGRAEDVKAEDEGDLKNLENKRNSIPYLMPRTMGRMNIAGSLVKIAGIEAPGNGSWFLRLTAVRKGEIYRLIRPLWPKPSFNFHNRTVRVTATQKPKVFEFYAEGGLDEAVGYASDIMVIVRNKLNFSDILVPTQGFGILEPNGEWKGMAGVLHRKEADIAPLDFSPSVSRATVVDFSYPIGEDVIVILSKSPSIIIKPFLLFQIFTPLAWVCLFGAALLVGGILELMDKVELKLHSNASKTSSGLRWIGNIVKICVYQSSSRWPKDGGGRLTAAGGIFFALIIGSLYRGSITAFFAIPFMSVPVDSPADLLASNVIPAARSRTYAYKALMDAYRPLLADKNTIVRPGYEKAGSFTGAKMATWEFHETVADGTYAVIDSYSSAIGRAINHERRGARCQFYLARTPVRVDMDMFAFMKNSPIAYQMDRTIRWLRMYGITQYIKDQYLALPCETEVTMRSLTPVSLTQAQGALYVMVFGLHLAFLGFLIEILTSLTCGSTS